MDIKSMDEKQLVKHFECCSMTQRITEGFGDYDDCMANIEKFEEAEAELFFRLPPHEPIGDWTRKQNGYWHDDADDFMANFILHEQVPEPNLYPGAVQFRNEEIALSVIENYCKKSEPTGDVGKLIDWIGDVLIPDTKGGLIHFRERDVWIQLKHAVEVLQTENELWRKHES